MKVLETTATRKATALKISEQLRVLNNALRPLHNEDWDLLNDIVLDLESQHKYINSSKTWNFNFTSGGWNTVSAIDKEQAIAIADAEHQDDPKEITYDIRTDEGDIVPVSKMLEPLRVNPTTFRIATPADTANLLSLFY